MGGPVLVAVRVPSRVLVVLRDRGLDAVLRHLVAHVAGVLIEWELRRVYAYDREAVAPVLRVPRLQLRQSPDAVDAGVRPEVDEHHAVLGAQRCERQGPVARSVEPLLRSLDLRRGA